MKHICAFLALMGIGFAASNPLLGQTQQTEPSSSSTAITSPAPADPALISEYLSVNGQVVGHRVESRDGEICLTCGKPITKDDVTYAVDGQRVPVHKGKCVGALAAKPVEWLSKLKPRGAFLDARAAKLGLSAGWLVLGSYILLGLIFGALAAHRAFSVGRDPLLWLVVGFLTNITGLAVLLALPRREVHALGGVPAGLAKVAATYAPEVLPSLRRGESSLGPRVQRLWRDALAERRLGSSKSGAQRSLIEIHYAQEGPGKTRSRSHQRRHGAAPSGPE